MIEHHHHYLLLLLSVLWNLGIAYKAKKAMEDEDANLVFKFSLAKTGIVHSSTGLRLGDKE
jgi:hypothetical protein